MDRLRESGRKREVIRREMRGALVLNLSGYDAVEKPRQRTTLLRKRPVSTRVPGFAAASHTS